MILHYLRFTSLGTYRPEVLLGNTTHFHTYMILICLTEYWGATQPSRATFLLYTTSFSISVCLHQRRLDPHCLWCRQGIATIGQMFWSCPALTHFWIQIFEAFSHKCGRPISSDPITTVFGVTAGEAQISTSQARAIAFASLLARRLILRQWKSTNPPSFLCWV